MAVYNLTNLTSSGTNMLTFTQEINKLTEGWMGYQLYIAFLIIFFMAFRARSEATTGQILAAVMWFGVILAVPFNFMGLISEVALIITFLAAIVSVAILVLKKEGTAA